MMIRMTSSKGMKRGLTSYGDADFSRFLRKAFVKAMGLSDNALARPSVGIANTFSDYNACHGNVPQLVEAAKRGVMLAGGLPMEFPTISVHESFSYPTSMFLRNLMAMDTEEMIRAQPMDAVVLIGGCDKTLPAQMMAAASVDLPAIVLPTGPMLVGHYKGEMLGACTDCRRLWASFRAGNLGAQEIETANARLAPSVGTCMVMGTASTMACVAEALGLALPGSATVPATHAERMRCAEASGGRAAEMAKKRGPRPSEVLTPAAFRNAMAVLQAIGGSTNGIIHLAAIAGRVGHRIDYAQFDRLGREVPVLIDLKPSGDRYMEHFHEAGGRKGAPGMPEAGYRPVPRKLARDGVKDMVRISDARMSGTAFGTIVLHIAPESAAGGPLALVETGDGIRLDVPARRLDLLVDEVELARRAQAAQAAPRANRPERGYARSFHDSVLQADEGCDFDFLLPGRRRP